MNRELRPTKSTYQIKEEQVNFLLEDIKKNLEKHKKSDRIKRQTTCRSKKILKGTKNNYYSLLK